MVRGKATATFVTNKFPHSIADMLRRNAMKCNAGTKIKLMQLLIHFPFTVFGLHIFSTRTRSLVHFNFLSTKPEHNDCRVRRRTRNGLDHLQNRSSMSFGHVGSTMYPALLYGMYNNIETAYNLCSDVPPFCSCSYQTCG